MIGFLYHEVPISSQIVHNSIQTSNYVFKKAASGTHSTKEKSNL